MNAPAKSVHLPIGLYVEPWGTIAAVGLTGGERYYWFVKNGDTSMIPASTVENIYANVLGQSET